MEGKTTLKTKKDTPAESARPSRRVDLAGYSTEDFDRGASFLREAVWIVIRSIVFLWNPFPFYGLKRMILRMFGAEVGEGVIIKPGVKITFPWRLKLGHNCWVGEETFILNLARVEIGPNACVSQRAFLCTGSHNYRDPDFSLMIAPIHVGEGAWVGACAFISPGIHIGRNAVLCAGSVASDDLPEDTICRGDPAREVAPRWK
jgi:putative colanic acid biosynthesis acetyltransferase WcaF